MTISSKFYLILGAIATVFSVAAAITLYSLAASEKDAAIVNAMGRQRMLTQAMAKSALGYSTAKNQHSHLEQQVTMVDNYITNMRAAYTQIVVPVANAHGIELSMAEDDHKQGQLPFPATLTRLVNNRFQENSQSSVDIIAKHPVNPNQTLKFASDEAAWEFITQNTNKIYSSPVERDGKMYQRFYTADTATVQACVDCHVGLQGQQVKLGDTLGIRRFEVPFSDDVALGRQLMNPSLHEYEQARDIFQKTLAAMKNGGEYPLDLGMTTMGYVEAIEDETSQAKIQEVEAKFSEFTGIVGKLLAIPPGSTQARLALQDVLSKSNELRKLSNDLVSLYAQVADRNHANIFTTMIIMLVVVLAIVIMAGTFFRVAVISRINDTVSSLREIARGDGDLTRRLDASKKDELGQLAEAFNEFTEKIQGLVGRVQASGAQLTSAASNLNGLADHTQQTIVRQQSEIDMVATAMNEMAATVQEVAHNTSAASEDAEQVDDQARNGREVVTQTVHSIHELSDGMERISKVIYKLNHESESIGTVLDVIRGVADQTNLLALNAAIEAARAGEQGRGFAVVADEVRTLASRTQSSTEDIQAMIERLQNGANEAVQVTENSRQKMMNSVSEVTRAEKSLDSITQSVGTIKDMSTQIASAAEEQTKVAEEINGNISRISQSADDSVETMNELAGNANELATLAEQMDDLVRQFRA